MPVGLSTHLNREIVLRASDERARGPEYIIAEAAQADLEQIDEYITHDDPMAALRLLDDLFAAMQRAADNPKGAGALRENLTDREVRFILVRRSYWIIYSNAELADVVIL